MISLSRIVVNILSNWIGFIFHAAVTLVLTPFVLHQLGETRYGVWVLTMSIVGYYGFMDLGLRGGINQYLTRYIAVKDYNRASECISTGITVLSLVGFFLLNVSITLAFIAPNIFNIPIGMEKEVFWVILMVGFTGALQCAFSPFGAVFTATQRFDLSNMIGVGTRLVMAASIYVSLRMEGGLIGISVATCGTNLIDFFLRWQVARRIAPELQISRGKTKWKSLREISSFGVWHFMISVSAFGFLHLQTLIIGVLMPIAAVAHFALASGMLGQIRDVLAPIGQVLYPVATELHARGENRALLLLYRNGGRFMTVATCSMALMAGAWAEDFYRLWIGEKFVIGSIYPSVAVLLQILLIGLVLSNTSNIGCQILSGSGRIKPLAIVVICESGITLIMTIILIRKYGLLGVALACVVSSFIVRLFVIPLMLQIILNLPVKDYLRSIIIRPVAVSILLVVSILGIKSAWTAVDWLSLITQGMLFTCVTVIVVLVVGATAEERDRFVWQHFRPLLKKIKIFAVSARII